jgi:hypothetical protein
VIEAFDDVTGGNASLVFGAAIVLVALLLARYLRKLRPALERSALGMRNALYVVTAAQGWVLTLLVLVVA